MKKKLTERQLKALPTGSIRVLDGKRMVKWPCMCCGKQLWYVAPKGLTEASAKALLTARVREEKS